MKNLSSNSLLLTPFLLLAVSSGLAGEDATALDKLLDRIVERERTFVKKLSTRTPLVETYIQESAGPESGRDRDHYFLGRLNFTESERYIPIAARSDAPKSPWRLALAKRAIIFSPNGFAEMIFVDPENFSRKDYSFDYVRREFTGGIRCIVFDLAPTDKKAPGRFIGRIWVEEHDLQIVRLNGTYSRSSTAKLYFHFDSWRLAASSGEWVPALVYVEEAADDEKRKSAPSFKAQTRLWGYNSGRAARLDELTSLAVELETPARQEDNPDDRSPLESQRSWERQAEANIIDRLEKAGLLAVKGPVDQVLDTVINNFLATSNLNVEVRCRVMLTTPLETFSVGRTIVISRGLIDVLPDEASLAMVLAEELAHIALGHRINTQFAFRNQTMFSDEDLLQRFRFSRKPEEIEAAGVKAVEILGKSPYQAKLGNAGLFLKALASRAPRYPNLIRANIGNRLADDGSIPRMSSLLSQAPQFEDTSLEQIAALPLGSRVKLDPWTGTITLMKAKPVSLLSAREKLLFEVTPFAPNLARTDNHSESAGSQ
ncbi:MAG: M48 family metalloprotease [Bryobacteraceae bacterium]